MEQKRIKELFMLLIVVLVLINAYILYMHINRGDNMSYNINGIFTSYAVNGKALGLYGDGVHDDTTALNNILLNYDNVYLPKGTYLISGTLIVPNSTNIFGDGLDTKIQLASTFNLTGYAWRDRYKYPIIRVGADCAIKDLLLNGDETECRDMGMVGIWIAGNNSYCQNVSTKNINYFPDDWIGGESGYGTVNAPGYALFISDCNNVSIDGGCFVGNGYEGIGSESAQNILIDGCYVGDGNRTGIQVHRYTKHIVIQNCIVNNTNVNKHADLTIHGMDDDYIDDVKIVNCSFVNPCEEKGSIQTVTGYEKNVIIQNCNFNSNNRCISVCHDRATGDETASKIIISGNIMKSVLDGIYVRGNKCIITNNIIDCTGQDITVTGEDKTIANNLVN